VFREATDTTTVQSPSLRDVPLAVISSADQPASVLASHEALVRLSSHGRHVVASKGGHWVPFDEPELVVGAIRDVVETVRRAHGPETPGRLTPRGVVPR
jgi:pimeloyl-ACP methyl ester carboxylesterase